MAYKYKDRYLKVGKAWQDDDGFKHPYNWSSSWSADDLKKWGVTIEKDVDTSFDNRFYWAKGIERKLEDENVVDDDGKAELVKICVAGDSKKLLSIEEMDTMPFISMTPVIMPHRFHGRSIAELVEDIQLILSLIHI